MSPFGNKPFILLHPFFPLWVIWLSKKKESNVKEVLNTLVNETMPKLMEVIIAEKDVAMDTKAARVGLANTALHHLKLLKAAYSSEYS